MSALRRGLLGLAVVALLAASVVICTPGSSTHSTDAASRLSKKPSASVARRSNAGEGFAVKGDLESEAYRGDAHARSRLCTQAMLEGEQTGSYQQAAYWCALGAEAGDAEAQAAYARLFQIGGGVAQDDAQAASWYEKAIAQQNPHAMYMRGRMLIASNDAADQSLGRMLLQRAAEMGDSNARWALQNEVIEPQRRRDDQTLLN